MIFIFSGNLVRTLLLLFSALTTSLKSPYIFPTSQKSEGPIKGGTKGSLRFFSLPPLFLASFLFLSPFCPKEKGERRQVAAEKRVEEKEVSLFVCCVLQVDVWPSSSSSSFHLGPLLDSLVLLLLSFLRRLTLLHFVLWPQLEVERAHRAADWANASC